MGQDQGICRLAEANKRDPQLEVLREAIDKIVTNQ
jgi:hypothetical protein